MLKLNIINIGRSMKLTIKYLRRIIKEEFAGSSEQIRQKISRFDPDMSADQLYFNTDTGKPELLRHQMFGSSPLHTNPKKHSSHYDEWNYSPNDYSPDTIKAPNSNDDLEYNFNSKIEYQKAIYKFVNSPAAHAGAESFFSSFPKWKSWSTDLGISRDQMKAKVKDMLKDDDQIPSTKSPNTLAT